MGDGGPHRSRVVWIDSEVVSIEYMMGICEQCISSRTTCGGIGKSNNDTASFTRWSGMARPGGLDLIWG